MERFFNTADSSQPEDSHTIDPLKRGGGTVMIDCRN